MDISKHLSEIIKVPQEVEEYFCSLENQKFLQNKEKFHKIYIYCKACANLYGMIPLKEVTEIIENYSSWSISVEELEELLEIYPNSEKYVEFDDGYLLSPILILEELFPAYQGAIKDVLRYLPDEDEFLLFSNDFYDETTIASKNLSTFLQELGYSEVQVENGLDALFYHWKLGYHLSDLYPLLEEVGISIVKAKERVVLQKLMEDFANHSRTWRLKGHSIGEIKEIPMPAPFDYSSYEAPASKNAKCPCGSGKKYKRCCGK